MAELMKDKFYNISFIQDLAMRINVAYPSFQVTNFVSEIMNEPWNGLELKERMRKITLNLRKYLPTDYAQALYVLDQVIDGLPLDYSNFAFMSFPEFVEIFGLDPCNFDLSVAALERYTASSSSEFAVRPFIIKYETQMMQQMAKWAKSENEHVRRLASEGCRPLLPWAQALNNFKKDPTLVLEILEQLKNDPSLYVRKSVANNLNDISKSHPDLVATIAKNWFGKTAYTDWIVKHGCRTLLKKGNKEVLSIFGFEEGDCVDIEKFTLATPVITIGEELIFSFDIIAKATSKVRLEYAIDYVKANNKRNRKVFQISEIVLKENQTSSYIKKHSFANMSTRKHYPGMHSVTLIVNGVEQITVDFEVLEIK